MTTSTLDNDNAGPPPIGALTVAGFAKLYNVGRTFVYSELASGRLKAHKAGSRTLILRSEADRWANALPLKEVRS
ncbi:helix-turn-helix domain-containing protein [Phenylobacterium sp.]|uniref:helix-turn-helix domain-containing protein n=1 Tax=Phenylobacterium sp. TaxID=1871053 RepID=UPI0035B2A276